MTGRRWKTYETCHPGYSRATYPSSLPTRSACWDLEATPQKAHTILLDLLNNVPPTPNQVRLIARQPVKRANRLNPSYYPSEYRFMIGDLIGGIGYLQQRECPSCRKSNAFVLKRESISYANS